MSHSDLSKVYEPHEVEERWISRWLAANAFSSDPARSGKPYSIVIPPPNVTGSLHMGHALNSTLQDILIRYHRMKGDNALWVVGTDHAGIATQNVVERQLAEENTNRTALGREKFTGRVWKWRKESGGTIIDQLKKLGASCDYAHERFTMDEGLSAAVRKVFVELHREKLIYRGERLINWCPRCTTALSDLEVEHADEAGHLWYIKYRRQESGDRSQEKKVELPCLVVATTRPETMLGDTAVAVHPDDERYKKWIGKKVLLPLVNRSIPVIADPAVDREFGTGAVKITPAHDFNDFEMGKRHQLETINILTSDGRISEAGGAYAGLTITKARAKVVEDLEKTALLDHIEPHKHAVGHCYRCKTVVEPYLSLQWFVSTKPLAEKAIEAVKKGKTRFVPEHWTKTYLNWMENIEDWCISRQIWWGHQIPAWYCENAEDRSQKSEVRSQNPDIRTLRPSSGQAYAHTHIRTCSPTVSETPPKQCPACGSTKLTQDPDVLDTWFSSALWPFSTLGWPKQTPELKKFYPTSVLVTAFDIIFFWVARMMMMGIHFMGEVPFKDVHIHALVRDPLGQKMSKSKGNVIDPLILMKKYGTDAFRFTLAAFAAQGRDIKLDEARVEGYRNFCNKIWNAFRFASMSALPFVDKKEPLEKIDPKQRINRWVLFELSQTIPRVAEAIEAYQFNRAASACYTFFWNFFCDWHLELSKEIYRNGTEEEKKETARTTFYVLDSSLRLLHPFMPFITEELWQGLSDRGEKLLALSPFPKPHQKADSYKKEGQEIELLIETVQAIRTIRQETGVPLSEAIEVKILPSGASRPLYREIESMILPLAKVKKIEFISTEPKEASALARAGDSLIVIPLQGLIDREKEKARQTKNLHKLAKDIEATEQKLSDAGFLANAQPELIEEKKVFFADAIGRKELIQKALRLL